MWLSTQGMSPELRSRDHDSFLQHEVPKPGNDYVFNPWGVIKGQTFNVNRRNKHSPESEHTPSLASLPRHCMLRAGATPALHSTNIRCCQCLDAPARRQPAAAGVQKASARLNGPAQRPQLPNEDGKLSTHTSAISQPFFN